MFDGRKVVFKALVGSHNYNLNDESSDKDYKYFVLPTFDDLYSGKMFSTSVVTPEQDYDAHDVRQLGHLFWKANINFLEVLFSNEISEMYGLEIGLKARYDVSIPIINKLFAMRDEIATMNLPYLYNACIGMHYQKMAKLDKASEGTQYLLDKYGYNTKEALHAYRVLDFLTRFDIYRDFKEAITYTYPDYMLEIKYGKFTELEFRSLVQCKMEDVYSLKSTYLDSKPNEKLKQTIDDLIKELVKQNI